MMKMDYKKSETNNTDRHGEYDYKKSRTNVTDQQ